MDYKTYNNINEIHEESGTNVARQEIYELWQLCFGDSDIYTDFYFNWKVKDNQILTIYKGDKLSSMLHLNPYNLQVNGKPMKANYIVGVATRQEDRRQGLMKLLLEKALLQMYDEQMGFTYLMPASESIYLPFDFRIVYEQEPWNKIIGNRNQQEEASLRAASFIDSSLINIEVLEEADKTKLNDLVTFSNEILGNTYDIYVERTPYYYTRLIHEMHSSKGEVLLCYEQGKPVGYVSYMAEDKIYITEMIYIKEEKQKVLQAVSDYFKSQLERKIYQPKEGSQVPAIMTRIVHWNSFVENITATEDIELIIKVTDPILEQNNGVFALQFNKAGCISKRSTKEPEIVAYIADITRLFFGEMDRKGLEQILNGSNKDNIMDKIDKLNTYNKLFINDVV